MFGQEKCSLNVIHPSLFFLPSSVHLYSCISPQLFFDILSV